MKIVSVAIQKGGAGKTTTAVNLAAGLRDRGLRCLLVDLDPQASLSQSLDIRDEPEPNIYHLLDQESSGEPAAAEKAIVKRDGLDVIPASLDLAGSELELVSVYGREFILKQILQRFDAQYDYVLIDCPPSIGMLTVNALVASTHLLMPILPEFLSLKAVHSFRRQLERIKKLIPDLREVGFLLTRYDGRKTMTAEVEQQLQKEFGTGQVFTSHIRNSIALAKAQEKGQDILAYDRGSNGARDYLSFTDEFLLKVAAL